MASPLVVPVMPAPRGKFFVPSEKKGYVDARSTQNAGRVVRLVAQPAPTLLRGFWPRTELLQRPRSHGFQCLPLGLFSHSRRLGRNAQESQSKAPGNDLYVSAYPRNTASTPSMITVMTETPSEGDQTFVSRQAAVPKGI